jgi:hypothetical protein
LLSCIACTAHIILVGSSSRTYSYKGLANLRLLFIMRSADIAQTDCRLVHRPMNVAVKDPIFSLTALVTTTLIDVGIHICKNCPIATSSKSHIMLGRLFNSALLIIDILLGGYSIYAFILHLSNQVLDIRDKHTTQLPLTF